MKNKYIASGDKIHIPSMTGGVYLDSMEVVGILNKQCEAIKRLADLVKSSYYEGLIIDDDEYNEQNIDDNSNKINKFFILDTLKHWTNRTHQMQKDELASIVEKRVEKFMKFVFEMEKL